MLSFLSRAHLLPPAPPLTTVVLMTSVNPRDLARLRHSAIADVLEKPLTEEKVQGLIGRFFPSCRRPLSKLGRVVPRANYRPCCRAAVTTLAAGQRHSGHSIACPA